MRGDNKRWRGDAKGFKGYILVVEHAEHDMHYVYNYSVMERLPSSRSLSRDVSFARI